MPSLEDHCKLSESRTGKKYEDLHRWMDQFYKEMGVTHRQQRHSLDFIEEVIERWGNEGVMEYLIHIITDYKDTANKLLKILKEIKLEKLSLEQEKKKIIKEYNELLEEAEFLNHATQVGVEYYLSSRFKKK